MLPLRDGKHCLQDFTYFSPPGMLSEDAARSVVPYVHYAGQIQRVDSDAGPLFHCHYFPYVNVTFIHHTFQIS